MVQHRRKLDLNPRARKQQLNRMYRVFEGVCQRCFSWIPREQATRDHVVDLVDGGSNGDENVILCCATCNHAKEMAKQANGQPQRRWRRR